jgi:hypothetical protein
MPVWWLCQVRLWKSDVVPAKIDIVLFLGGLEEFRDNSLALARRIQKLEKERQKLEQDYKKENAHVGMKLLESANLCIT